MYLLGEMRSWVVIRLDHIVTNSLAIIGFIMISFGCIICIGFHWRLLKRKLFTVKDGTKLFEKLKYDLRIDTKIKVSKERLYSDQNYAQTIFRGAMDYNRRDVVAYFSERSARIMIRNCISKYAWLTFWLWFLFLIIVFGGTYADFAHWLIRIRDLSPDNTSGMISIFIAFLSITSLTVLLRYWEYKRLKVLINDEIVKIQLAKKQKVWINYLWIYYSSILIQSLGLIFIIFNMIVA
ncbi:hypothetical protein [Spiroplasma endosymbiont of Aspidapion aeneum]|uniref:hypothetical protein n=1 Tax=Spiroplasma endosymbiont of Aspidapion aeneum TaxID=3066276 RepID=UPI00313B4E37